MGRCDACPDGTSCINGQVDVLAGFYVKTDETTGHMTSVACSSRCLAGGQCAANRVGAADNPLCGQCVSGYSEWGGHCVKCETTRWGVLVGLALLALAFTMVFHLVSQTSSATLGKNDCIDCVSPRDSPVVSTETLVAG